MKPRSPWQLVEARMLSQEDQVQCQVQSRTALSEADQGAGSGRVGRVFGQRVWALHVVDVS